MLNCCCLEHNCILRLARKSASTLNKRSRIVQLRLLCLVLFWHLSLECFIFPVTEIKVKSVCYLFVLLYFGVAPLLIWPEPDWSCCVWVTQTKAGLSLPSRECLSLTPGSAWGHKFGDNNTYLLILLVSLLVHFCWWINILSGGETTSSRVRLEEFPQVQLQDIFKRCYAGNVAVTVKALIYAINVKSLSMFKWCNAD